MRDSVGVPSGRPSVSHPKRRNAVWKLYDAPPYRDWAFWATLAWGVLAAISIGTSDKPREIPVWLDALLATLFFMAFFGVLPAWVRLRIRRRRDSKSTASSARAETGPSHGDDARVASTWAAAPEAVSPRPAQAAMGAVPGWPSAPVNLKKHRPQTVSGARADRHVPATATGFVDFTSAVPAWIRLVLGKRRSSESASSSAHAEPSSSRLEEQPRTASTPAAASTAAATHTAQAEPGAIPRRSTASVNLQKNKPTRGIGVQADLPPISTTHVDTGRARQPAARAAGSTHRSLRAAALPHVAHTGPTPVPPWAVPSGKLPHPAARAMRRLRQAHTPEAQYDDLLDAAETLAIVVSSTVAALLQHWKPQPADLALRTTALSALKSRYFSPAGVMFGSWTSWLRNQVSSLASGHEDVLPGLSAALDNRSGSVGLIESLDALREERNRAAHGERPKSRPEAALRVEENLPHLEAALAKAAFMGNLPWILIESCTLRRRAEVFEVTARGVMGDHPDYETLSYEWGRPVVNDSVYVMSPQGPAEMSPLVANMFCQRCREVELAYLQRVNKSAGTAELKSFNRGHVLTSHEFAEEFMELSK